jgi:S-adenosylmethionine hydrolase
MPIITLTTDFGLRDPYAGALKGAIYKEMIDAHVVDISHLISPFHIAETAYIIQKAYHNFPDGTVHIIGVDAELTPHNRHVVVFLNKHYFVCADNGVLSLIVNKIRPELMVEITIHDRVDGNITALDVLIKSACHIARGGKLELIGKPITELKEIVPILAKKTDDESTIYGQVIYIDNYGNAITNITAALMKAVGKGRSFVIAARSTKFKRIYERYSDIAYENPNKQVQNADGLAVAIFNSSNYLELATYKSNPLTVGSAATLFGLQVDAPVIVTFDKL